MKTKKSKRAETSALAVRREVAHRFSMFCKERGLVVAFATEQALALWMREQGRTMPGRAGDK
jgi:hypothetical protein